MSSSILRQSVTSLPKIGKARAAQLEKLGIRTLYDLITYFPRAYEDRTHMVKIDELVVGEPACFRAIVASVPHTSRIRDRLTVTKLTVADETARLRLVFFNQPYVSDSLQYGKEYCFYGALQEDYGAQMRNPQFEDAEQSGVVTNRILPIYSLTEGVRNKWLGETVAAALRVCLPIIDDILPPSVLRKYGLMPAQEAYRAIHAPKSFDELSNAKRRLVFEEFFIFSAGLALLRADREEQKKTAWQKTDISEYLNALPYSLTNAQMQALRDIQADVTSGHPMNRLIQGDVGSGKTAIAAAAAYLAFLNAEQAALIAPTEILAEQHFKSLSALLQPLGMRIALLTGSLAAGEKKKLKSQLENREIDFVIGTHALLTEDVSIPSLGLVITDEQHRFGVQQRGTLASKGVDPHLLFLSATPIPRTLSLILYGDMDVSVISELPPGRKPIETYLVGETMRRRIFAFIRKQAAEHHQVYVVCPAVEENTELELKSAEMWADTLQKTVFPDLSVGLLHGKMKAADKDAAMRRFVEHKTDILVATTVIEVGVDVPNATLIVIEDADRFGLSQLHQLRGRVGRGDAQSYCVLFSSTKREETLERLKAFCATNDGFKIAEKDLALRGPGDFFGNRQHGLPQFRVADLGADLQTLYEAQEATKLLQADDLLSSDEYAPLIERIHILFAEGMPVLN